MTWLGWIIVALYGVTTIACIARVGRPNKPNSGRDAALLTALNAAIVVGILAIGTGHLG